MTAAAERPPTRSSRSESEMLKEYAKLMGITPRQAANHRRDETEDWLAFAGGGRVASKYPADWWTIDFVVGKDGDWSDYRVAVTRHAQDCARAAGKSSAVIALGKELTAAEKDRRDRRKSDIELAQKAGELVSFDDVDRFIRQIHSAMGESAASVIASAMRWAQKNPKAKAAELRAKADEFKERLFAHYQFEALEEAVKP